MGLDMYLYRKSDNTELMYWRKANAIHNWFVVNIQSGSDDCDEYEVSKTELGILKYTVDTLITLIGKNTILPTNSRDWENLAEFTKIINKNKSLSHIKEVGEKLLPTKRGSFFGDVNYDIGYIYDLYLTSARLETILKDNNNDTIYYRSSW